MKLNRKTLTLTLRTQIGRHVPFYPQIGEGFVYCKFAYRWYSLTIAVVSERHKRTLNFNTFSYDFKGGNKQCLSDLTSYKDEIYYLTVVSHWNNKSFD